MKNRTKWIIALITLATVALVGLGVAAQAAGKDASISVGTEWTLESFGPIGSEKAVLEGTEITLAIGEDNKISGSAGCNRYFSNYEAKGSELSLGMIVSTRMACPEKGMEQEAEYLNVLGSVSGFETDEGTLQVFYDDGQGVLNFVAL